MARLNRQERRDQTRFRLRDAARAEIARNGVGAASIDRISEAAGFSRGAFYSNYRSKSDLLLELVAEVHEREVAVWRSLIEQTDDVEALLVELEARFDEFAQRQDWWMLSAELHLEARRNAEFGEAYHAYHRRLMEKVKALVAAMAAKSGRTDPADIEILTATLRALSVGVMADLSSADAKDSAVSPGQVIAHFLRGVLSIPR